MDIFSKIEGQEELEKQKQQQSPREASSFTFVDAGDGLYRVAGVNPPQKQTWIDRRYAYEERSRHTFGDEMTVEDQELADRFAIFLFTRYAFMPDNTDAQRRRRQKQLDKYLKKGVRLDLLWQLFIKTILESLQPKDIVFLYEKGLDVAKGLKGTVNYPASIKEFIPMLSNQELMQENLGGKCFLFSLDAESFRGTLRTRGADILTREQIDQLIDKMAENYDVSMIEKFAILFEEFGFALSADSIQKMQDISKRSYTKVQFPKVFEDFIAQTKGTEESQKIGTKTKISAEKKQEQKKDKRTAVEKQVDEIFESAQQIIE